MVTTVNAQHCTRSEIPIIVIPTYNERGNIAPLIAAVRRTVPSLEILVVDDTSPDGTATIVEQLAQSDPLVHIIVRSEKNGYGKAVTAGFEWALRRGFDRILQMDADWSHDPKYLPAILRQSETADLVIGSRYVPGGGTLNWGLRRRLLSRAGNAYARTLLGVKIRDLTGGFRCWKRQLLQAINLSTIQASGYSFMIESLYRAQNIGAAITEVPIVFADRTLGRSKMSQHIVHEALLMVWRIRRH